MTAPTDTDQTPSKVTVEIIRSTWRRKQPWRWIARTANGRQLANSGEWYTNRKDAVTAIYTLFGDGSEVVLVTDIGPTTLRTPRQ